MFITVQIITPLSLTADSCYAIVADHQRVKSHLEFPNQVAPDLKSGSVITMSRVTVSHIGRIKIYFKFTIFLFSVNSIQLSVDEKDFCVQDDEQMLSYFVPALKMADLVCLLK